MCVQEDMDTYNLEATTVLAERFHEALTALIFDSRTIPPIPSFLKKRLEGILQEYVKGFTKDYISSSLNELHEVYDQENLFVLQIVKELEVFKELKDVSYEINISKDFFQEQSFEFDIISRDELGSLFEYMNEERLLSFSFN